MVAKPTGEANAPVNAYYHLRKLADATTRYGGSPNVDTLYSIAHLDLSKEPIVLTVPDEHGRYYNCSCASTAATRWAVSADAPPARRRVHSLSPGRTGTVTGQRGSR